MDNPAPLCAVVMVSPISFIPLNCTVSQLISLHIHHCMRLNMATNHHVISDYLIFLVFVNDALRTIQELYKASSLSSSTVDDVAGSIPIFVSQLMLLAATATATTATTITIAATAAGTAGIVSNTVFAACGIYHVVSKE